MNNKGWISIHRKLEDSWLWEQKPFGKGQAFIDLIIMANYQDRKILVNGELMNIERGQRLTSLSKLSDRWGWSTRTVKKFLKLLESDKMIVLQIVPRRYTLITIENYTKYQSNDPISVSGGTSRGTSGGVSGCKHEVYINNKDNKDNKDNNIMIDHHLNEQIKKEWIKATGRFPNITDVNLPIRDIQKGIKKINDSQYLKNKIEWNWFIDNIDKVINGVYDDWEDLPKKYYKPKIVNKKNNDEEFFMKKLLDKGSANN